MKNLDCLVWTVLLCLALAACGGGGSGVTLDDPVTGSGGGGTGSGSGSGGPEPETAELGKRVVNESFSFADIVDRRLKPSAGKVSYLRDSLGKASQQNRTYTSSDESVATIDASGWVDVVAPGTTTLQARDETGLIDELNVESISPDFRFRAWVGSNDTLVEFDPGAKGMLFVRSRDERCDIEQYASCTFGQADTVSDDPVTDLAATLEHPGFYHFDFGFNQTFGAILGSATYDPRNDMGVTVFRNKLWVIGGAASLERYGDVWSSDDGDTWTKVVESAPFTAREDFSLVEFDGRLFLIGGSPDTFDVVNDVWSSADGIEWTLETASAQFSPRKRALAYVHGDYLYVANGTDGFGVAQRDLWRSLDGRQWEQVNPGVEFPGYYGGKDIAFFDGAWWLLADIKEESLPREVVLWRSENGEDWTPVVEEFNGGNPSDCRITTNASRLWAFCYSGVTNYGWIRTSANGFDWDKVAGGIFWGNLRPFSVNVVAFRDEVYLVGGRATVFSGRNDVYSSPDGLNWRNHGKGGFYAARAGHSVTEHNGMLYSVGGQDSLSIHQGVWSSSDGLEWSRVTSEVPFSNRTGHATLSFNDRLWMIGGHGLAGGITLTNVDGDVTRQTYFLRAYNSVWSSGDGATWTKAGDPPFSARKYASAIVFNGRLWLVSGGAASGGVIPSDVWVSDDGETWTQATADAGFPGRQGHALTEMNGRLWLSGGADADGYLMNDVWSSADGTNWRQETADAAFVNRAYHQMVAYDGALWIVGGQAYNYDVQIDFEPTLVESSDVWRSSDGVTWTEVTAEATFEVRSHHQMLVRDGALWLFGGLGRKGFTEGSVAVKTITIEPEYFQEVWSSTDGLNWRQGFSHGLTLETYAE